jgi:hypothetical protein
MANPSTATPTAASIVATADQLNRDLVALVTSTTEAGLQTTFEFQNAALATSQAWLESSTSITRDALRRWSELAQQAQATSLKSYKGYFDSLSARN